jgi:hypothetical protein
MVLFSEVISAGSGCWLEMIMGITACSHQLAYQDGYDCAFINLIGFIKNYINDFFFCQHQIAATIVYHFF